MSRILGTVNVEISIEKDIISHIKNAKFLLNKNKEDAKLELKSALKELLRLIGLEAREPGKGKYIEIKEIKIIFNDLNKALSGLKKLTKENFIGIFNKLNDAITELKKLENMELRLG